jgi:hypothetical protein
MKEQELKMKDNYKVNLPTDFPVLLFNSGKSLEQLGISGVAWDWENAIKVVEFLCSCKYAILGGDVYGVADDKLKVTYDSWYENKDEKQSKERFIEETKNKAISYIKKYYERNGGNFYYSIVFDKI